MAWQTLSGLCYSYRNLAGTAGVTWFSSMGLICQQTSQDQNLMTKSQEQERKQNKDHMKFRLHTVTSPLPLHSLEPSKSQESPDLRKDLESHIQFSSVTQSCLTLCNPMECSTPGFPVHHQLPELTQTHVHQVSDAIQPSHPLSSPYPPAFNLSQHQGLFK